MMTVILKLSNTLQTTTTKYQNESKATKQQNISVSRCFDQTIRQMHCETNTQNQKRIYLSLSLAYKNFQINYLTSPQIN